MLRLQLGLLDLFKDASISHLNIQPKNLHEDVTEELRAQFEKQNSFDQQLHLLANELLDLWIEEQNFDVWTSSLNRFRHHCRFRTSVKSPLQSIVQRATNFVARSQVFDCALTAKGGSEMEITIEPGLSPAASLADNFEGEKIRVQTRNLDECLDRDAPTPALIAIDVEGAEHEVLKGASETLKKGPDLDGTVMRPIFVIRNQRNQNQSSAL